jgi:hypothetical protein
MTTSSTSHTEPSLAAKALRRSREIIPLLLVAALMIALGIFFLVRMLANGRIHEGGPLAPPPDHRDAVATPVRVNTPYSWGLLFVTNQSGDPAQLETLDLGQVPLGLRVLGSYVIDPTKGGTIGFLHGYEASKGRPVAQAVIPPKATYEIIVGLSATANGRHVISQAKIRYTSGGRKYEATFHQAVVLCAPIKDYQDGCPSPL